MTKAQQLLCVLCGPLCLALLSGCGAGSGIPSTVPAAGKVTFEDGSPVTNGALSFTGTGKTTYAVTATTDANGQFKVITTDGQSQVDGAPPGKYKVTITSAQAAGGGDPAGDPLGDPGAGSQAFAPEYGDPTKTPVEVEIPAGGKENITITVKKGSGGGGLTP